MQSLKESFIREYITQIDFKRDNWKLSKMKEDMRKFLGEEPGIEVVYRKDVMINETTQEPVEFVDVDKIEIIFTDLDNRFKKLEFHVNQTL
jgi:hypothetical protein